MQNNITLKLVGALTLILSIETSCAFQKPIRQALRPNAAAFQLNPRFFQQSQSDFQDESYSPYRSGFQKGREDGQEQGRREGHEKGYNDGWENGANKAQTAGQLAKIVVQGATLTLAVKEIAKDVDERATKYANGAAKQANDALQEHLQTAERIAAEAKSAAQIAQQATQEHIRIAEKNLKVTTQIAQDVQNGFERQIGRHARGLGVSILVAPLARDGINDIRSGKYLNGFGKIGASAVTVKAAVDCPIM